MTRHLRLTVAAVIFLAAGTICTAIPSRPEPQRLVNDFAGLFTPAEKNSLERILTAFDDSTSNQITVVTVSDLEGSTAAEYATRIGLEWGVGAEQYDNGIVVLVKPKTPDSNGQVNISVGYGLEGAIPDIYAKRIIDNEMIPRFAQNDYFGGVSAGCAVLMKLASGEISEVREKDDNGKWIAIVFLASIFIIICAALSSGRRGGGNSRSNGNGPDLLDAIIIGSLIDKGHRGSSGGSFGGGFGGGFGGFGGGSFGGGGASGSW